MRAHGLHGVCSHAAAAELAGRFGEPLDYEHLCDALYLADFDAWYPMVAEEEAATRKKAAGPRAPPTPLQERAQRRFALAFGRAHRRRALHQRLASLATDGKIGRAGFLASAEHLVDAGGVDAVRADLPLLADALFVRHEALPLDGVVEAATSLAGVGALLRLGDKPEESTKGT